MPYIDIETRQLIARGSSSFTAGELNYAITRLVNKYIIEKGGVRYSHINEAIGVLECAKLELYRRIAAPHEDRKMEKNGDVYTVTGLP